jgi:outer membrane protein TolC
MDENENGTPDPAADPIENTPDPVEDAQADILASAQSRIAELEMQLADAQATILKVQAHNYSLLMGTAPEGDTASTPVNSQNSDDPEEIVDPVDVFFDDED